MSPPVGCEQATRRSKRASAAKVRQRRRGDAIAGVWRPRGRDVPLPRIRLSSSQWSTERSVETSKSSRTVVVVNPQGIHARPADLIVRLTSQYTNTKIEIVKQNTRVDGKSIWDILTLFAEKGTELTIEADGPDAGAALDSLAELFAQGFAEME